ncbi:MAG: modification methylase protein [Candidatus Azambacteria bacterium GW2011_GWE1_42_9]|nr:MAG: modification methylase protein [Candidatus Azambacteria bacterium GW2011_GWF1_41_10]KKS49612.1 MAG: modification methylase protein [Candidatus Azambacteria bacterium GW2011_GWF2_42_22]KKS69696.1 MAG: modification methylase protein [Candidatus Azambacteria bacterium GW2011_GWA2_42_62]KKS73863.1 MAG: modification methylase protein [Candidatus Azambacteria bacterium GW2011_GWB1_42_72]KKS79001.1 MAG: modification methylase protein [Candidatus Azambacteria bacterium GW2011_GWE1_42_9]KKT0372
MNKPTSILHNDHVENFIDIKLSTKIIIGDSREMKGISNNSVHLIVTSPPYFNAKTYSDDFSGKDIGNINDYEQWKDEIKKVWSECLRVLQPGRRLFINIMNLPLKSNGKDVFKTLNIVGHTIDMCEDLGFIFKREIIWHKTNGVRAHFGTYPYPGGILINNMHEQILEFEKPNGNGSKYDHLSKETKEASKISKDFWLSLKNSDVWLMKPYKSGTREHLAPFPIELPSKLIKAYSYITETVLDPFGGMGTTARAAIQEKRNSIIYEINKSFLPLIESNINDDLFNKVKREVTYQK